MGDQTSTTSVAWENSSVFFSRDDQVPSEMELFFAKQMDEN